MTSFIDLIQQRRSCRLYEEKPVTQEQIETLKKTVIKFQYYNSLLKITIDHKSATLCISFQYYNSLLKMIR